MKGLLIATVTRYPWRVLAVVLGLTALALWPIADRGLKQDFSPYLLPPEHPSRIAYEQLRETFTGTGEAVLVHLRHPDTIFRTRFLRRLQGLSEALEQVHLLPVRDLNADVGLDVASLPADLRAAVEGILAGGVTEDDRDRVSALQAELTIAPPAVAERLAPLMDALTLRLRPVRKVTSLATMKDLVAEGDRLVVRPFYVEAPADDRAMQALRDRVEANALLNGILVSEDRQSAAIVVETRIRPEDTGLMYDLYERIRAVVQAHPGEAEVGVAGVPAAVALGRNFMERDSQVLFPVVVVLVVTALFITFRMVSGILLPLVVVVLSIGWTLGVMALLGIPLNLITNVLPVFLITIGVADGVHMIAEFRAGLADSGTRPRAVAFMLRRMTAPVVITSLTTAAGFLSLAYTDIRFIREFGVLVAFGVMVAMVVSLAFIPAALMRGRRSAPQAGQVRAGGDAAPRGAVGRLLELLLRGVFGRRRPMLAVFLVVGVLAGFGTARVVVDSNVIAYFQEDVPIVQASRALDRHMAGSTSLDLMVTAPPGMEEPFKRPDLLAGIEGLQRHLELYFPAVGRTLALPDLLGQINLVMHDGNPSYHRLPREREFVSVRNDAGSLYRPVSGRDQISQYLLLYEGGGGDLLADMVDAQFRKLRVAMTLTTSSSPAIERIADEAERYASAHLPADTRLQLAGWGELNVSMNREIVRGQIISLSLSVAGVFGVLLVLFRSLTRALLAAVPLLYTILVNFGVMGWTGIPLDIGTALVSAIAIGIGIDFAIHFIARLDMELATQGSPRGAVRAALLESGPPIAANALIVATGFLALTVSQFNPIRQIGWLISQTLVVSAVATLVLLPLLIVVWRPGFVYGRTASDPEQDEPGAVRFRAESELAGMER